jgi:hypothetical protein
VQVFVADAGRIEIALALDDEELVCRSFHATTSISGRGIDLLFSATFSGFVISTFTPIRVQKPCTSKNRAAMTSKASMEGLYVPR